MKPAAAVLRCGVVAFVVGVAAGWVANGWRMSARIAKIDENHAELAREQTQALATLSVQYRDAEKRAQTASDSAGAAQAALEAERAANTKTVADEVAQYVHNHPARPVGSDDACRPVLDGDWLRLHNAAAAAANLPGASGAAQPAGGAAPAAAAPASAP